MAGPPVLAPPSAGADPLRPSGDPIFLHRPHGGSFHGITDEVRRDFAELSRQELARASGLRYGDPDDLTFVTYHNYRHPTLIERCYEAHGITRYAVLGQEVATWDWGAKVTLVLDYLEAGACSTRYVACTDADDVLLIADPSPIVERFLAHGCDVLFCNTFVDYPPDDECRDFETLTYHAQPLHCRLSAGGYVADARALVSYLRTIAAAYRNAEPWAMADGGFNDQLAWRRLHKRHFPALRVDSRSRIFKRYDLFRRLD